MDKRTVGKLDTLSRANSITASYTLAQFVEKYRRRLDSVDVVQLAHIGLILAEKETEDKWMTSDYMPDTQGGTYSVATIHGTVVPSILASFMEHDRGPNASPLTEAELRALATIHKEKSHPEFIPDDELFLMIKERKEAYCSCSNVHYSRPQWYDAGPNEVNWSVALSFHGPQRDLAECFRLMEDYFEELRDHFDLYPIGGISKSARPSVA